MFRKMTTEAIYRGKSNNQRISGIYRSNNPRIRIKKRINKGVTRNETSKIPYKKLIHYQLLTFLENAMGRGIGPSKCPKKRTIGLGFNGSNGSKPE